MRYFLGIGSNLGERLAYLQAAAAGLVARGITVLRSSCVYETTPVDAPDAQPDYLNAVVECESTHELDELLKVTQAIEREHGRARGARNAARTLDIDILLAADVTCVTDTLTLPHPRMHERLFVLTPLRELAPAAMHPVFQQTIDALYHACRAASRECVRLFAPPFVLMETRGALTP